MGNNQSNSRMINSDAYVTLSSHGGDNLSSPMNVETLIARHHKHLPLAVSTYKVAKNKSCNVSFREGNALCVHFHKESEVVTVETKEGAKYVVPLRSSFLCSPLYSAGQKEGSSYEGTVSQLWDDRTGRPPRMVFITQGYLSPSGEESSCVEEGQMLAIKGFINGNSVLKCIDIHSYEEKLLEKDCAASFTTDPTLLKMSLENYIEHIALPVTTIFFSPLEAQSLGFPESLECTITSSITAQSVIASPYSIPLSVETDQVVEILLTSPVYLSIIRLPKNEDDLLKQKTLKLLKNFSPSLVAEVVANISTPIDTNIQTILYRFIEQDIYWRQEFVSKDMPILKDRLAIVKEPVKTAEEEENDESDYEDVYEVIDPQNTPLPPLPKEIEILKDNLQQYQLNSGSGEKVITETPPATTERQLSSPLPYYHQPSSGDQPAVNSLYSTPREVYPKGTRPAAGSKPTPPPKPSPHYSSPKLSRPPGITSSLQRHHSLGNEPSYKTIERVSLTEHEKTAGELMTKNTSTQQKHEVLAPSNQALQLDSNRLSKDNSLYDDARAINKEKLESYSVQQVLDLLDKLGLSQYKDRFEEEQITGSLLLEIDEEILSEELGVKGKLHKLKIMRIIEGRQSL